MNETALFTYLAREMKTFVFRLNQDRNLTGTWFLRHDLRDPVLNRTTFKNALLSLTDTSIPCMVLVNGLLLFSVLTLPDGFLIIGPNLPPANLPVQKHLTDIPLAQDPQQTLSVVAPQHYLDLLLLAHNLYNDPSITQYDLFRANNIDADTFKRLNRSFHQTQFHRCEYGFKHNPYDQEVREQAAIESGDVDALMKSIQEEYTGEVGTLAKDPLRHMKNLAIVNTTLASRSAIRGGMAYEVAFSLSDSYIQLYEEMSDVSSIEHMFRSMEIQYTQMVHEMRRQKEAKGADTQESILSPHVSACKDYIYSHLHDQLSVQNISQALGVSANYLSALFRKEEGMPLSRYILEEKINRCKNMLIYSDYTLLQISNYLGFSSQSHLGKRFKDITGYTLRQYRSLYQVNHY